MNELNTKRLRTRAIPVLLPVVLLGSSLVPLERSDTVGILVNDDSFDVESLNLIKN